MFGTQVVSLTLEVVTCFECSFTFGLEQSFEKKLRNNHKSFFCPRCRASQYFPGESDEQKLRRQLGNEKKARLQEQARHDQTKATLRTAKRSHSATKGQMTKLRRRIGVGVCPCCNRTFRQLARHMQSKHPEYGSRKRKAE